MEKGKYYLTTAIAYTSQKPHIGNSYEVILSDVVARFKRLQGHDVFFLTGTDEHGQKIENSAKEAGISPQKYVDDVAGQILEICKLLNISYDDFIRTTNPAHKQAVQEIFAKLYEQGDIYKSHYEGWYCTPDESFYTEAQLVDGNCPDCGRKVVRTNEEAYFFKLSKYQKQLEEHIEKNPGFIFPESRKKEMINNFLKPGLQDLCVSRSSFKWGIPVPFDDGHVIYVWIDALSNYITALGYTPSHKSVLFEKYWPADVQIIGKDILRFHTIYWPIILMALGEELPKSVFGHPWMLFGEDKMSKSRGNVIYADDLAKLIGVDGVRYYSLSEMPYAQDGSITYERVFERYNSDLANTLGNLVNRTIAMTHKYFAGVLPAERKADALDDTLAAAAQKSVENTYKSIESFHFADGLHGIIQLAARANKYIDETTPWVLAKEDENKPRLAAVLYNLIETIRILGVLLQPFLPATAEEIFRQINCPEDLKTLASIELFGAFKEISVQQPVPLFARIDADKLIEELLAENKQEKEAAAHEIEHEPEMDFADFMKTELRCGEIISCEKVEKADKLLKLSVFDGEGNRTIVSGIAQWYTADDLVGKKIVVVANLKPAKLRGIMSEGMLLAADGADGSAQVVFLQDSALPGSRIH